MIVGAFILVSCLLSREAVARGDAAGLVAALRQGGHVVFLRHARTNAEEIDTGRLGDRSGQRNLSADGIAQATALGDGMRALEIPFDRILASPVYRARDTGELAFGEGNIEVTMELVADDYAGPQLQDMIQATRRLLSMRPPDGENTLLIGHRTPLQMVTGMGFPDSVLPEGAMAVFVPEGTETRLLGTLTAEELISLAGSAP
jgi:phosphohistidine phosphatase SixA